MEKETISPTPIEQKPLTKKPKPKLLIIILSILIIVQAAIIGSLLQISNKTHYTNQDNVSTSNNESAEVIKSFEDLQKIRADEEERFQSMINNSKGFQEFKNILYKVKNQEVNYQTTVNEKVIDYFYSEQNFYFDDKTSVYYQIRAVTEDHDINTDLYWGKYIKGQTKNISTLKAGTYLSSIKIGSPLSNDPYENIFLTTINDGKTQFSYYDLVRQMGDGPLRKYMIYLNETKQLVEVTVIVSVPYTNPSIETKICLQDHCAFVSQYPFETLKYFNEIEKIFSEL